MPRRPIAPPQRVAIFPICLSICWWFTWIVAAPGVDAVAQTPLREIPLQSQVTRVQPMTGIVLWNTNDQNNGDWIQLEFSYMRYDEIIRGLGQYDWSSVDQILDQIASRGHQAILRFYFEYPGKEAAVPAFIKASPGYQVTKGKSEGQATTFSDWTNLTLQQQTLAFYTALAARYDNDPRLAFIQTGFGLWAEYHIYDGPMVLGKTFPSHAYQAAFANHLSSQFRKTPWSISIDAADDTRSPMAQDKTLRELPFGLFDDSFLHKNHHQYNARSWKAFGVDRWQQYPAGGELSYYTKRDQKLALAPDGPYGIAFKQLAADYHITYMIGDGQTQYQSKAAIAQAGQSLGYKFRITRFGSAPSGSEHPQGVSEVTVINEGIAPLYHDAYVAINGTRASESLRGLLPREAKTFIISAGGAEPMLTIACDRLVPGQTIEFNASL